MTILSFILCYVAFAFVCACLYRYAHAVAGAPSLNSIGHAQYQNDMVLSFLGRWVAQRYNSWEQAQNIKLRKELEISQSELSSQEKLGAKGMISAQRGISFENVTDEDIRNYLLNQKVQQLRQERVFINPYSALGVCALCSALWFYAPLAAVGLGLYSDITGQALGAHGWWLGICLFPSLGFTLHQLVERLANE